jgi:glyoxylase-like metal-dependent hydrolase (beta-lactamase superfamily II)
MSFPVVRVGNVPVVALDDGEFRMPADFLSDPTPHRELAGPDGVVRLPIGSFLIPGDEPVLVDLGFGPRADALLTGGRLLGELGRAGHEPADIRTIALTHPHPDHVGWLATVEGDLVFPNARVLLSEADWRHFVETRTGALEEHLLQAFLRLRDTDRLVLVDSEQPVTRSVTALPAPGHTPGHTVFVIHDSGRRALLLGDAVHCPQQLTHTDWGAVGDVDPHLAARTREWLYRDLEAHDGAAIGCHFPGLSGWRILGGSRAGTTAD